MHTCIHMNDITRYNILHQTIYNIESKDNIEVKTQRGRPALPKRNINTVTIVKVYLNDSSDYFITATRLNPLRVFNRYVHKIRFSKEDNPDMYQFKHVRNNLMWQKLDEFQIDEKSEMSAKQQVYARMKEAINQQMEKCKGRCLSNVDRYLHKQRKQSYDSQLFKKYYEKKRDFLLEKVECAVCNKIIARGSMRLIFFSFENNFDFK